MTDVKDSKLKEMLIGYAAAHQHPLNVFVHLVGIPVIMLGVCIPLSWGVLRIGGFEITLAHAAAIGLFAFYLSLDAVFALVFLAIGLAVAEAAVIIGDLPRSTALIVAAAAFFGGYLLQFVGHAIERSMPVLIKHPIQANLAAPFFVVVELFSLVGLRQSLFAEVQEAVKERRQQEAPSH